MSTQESLGLIRCLEFALFGGVTESPESMFERDVHANTQDRETRRALGMGEPAESDPAMSALGRLYVGVATRVAL